MTAIWTTPKTWAVGEIVTADSMNAHVRDNLDFLKLREDTPLNTSGQIPLAGFSTNLNVFADMHATLLTLSLTTVGAPVLLGLCGSFANTSVGAECIFTLTIDGTNIGDASYGLQLCHALAASQYAAFSWVGVYGLAAGAHVVKARWRTSTGVLSASFASSLYAVELI